VSESPSSGIQRLIYRLLSCLGSQVASNLRLSQFKQIGHGVLPAPLPSGRGPVIGLCGLRDYEQATRSNRCCLLLMKEFLRFERVKGHKFQVKCRQAITRSFCSHRLGSEKNIRYNASESAICLVFQRDAIQHYIVQKQIIISAQKQIMPLKIH